MLPRLALSLLAISPLLWAADPVSDRALQIIHVSNTDTLTLPAGGALRLQHSFGELSVEGWDRREVEVTVVKSTKDFYAPKDPHATADLDRVHVSAELKGKDVVISTGYPHRTFPPSLPWTESDIDVEYRIKAPMDAPFFVDHGIGEVHFYNISGDVHASVHDGGITFDLSPDSRYAIHANCDWGGVISDFPGKPHRRFWLIGHQFTGKPADAPHQLVLKAGYGDIVILKNWKPDSTQ